MKFSEILLGLLRIPLDILAMVAALVVSFRLRMAQVDLIPGVQLLDPATTLPSLDHYLKNFLAPSIVVFVALATVLGLYQLRTTKSSWREMGGVVVASLLWLVAVVAWFFFVEKQLFYSRVLLFHAVFFLGLFVILGRTAVILLQRVLLRSGIGVRLAVTIGAHPASPAAQAALREDRHYLYLGHLPDCTSLKQLLTRHAPDIVLQTDPNPASSETLQLIDYCRSHHLAYAFLPPVLGDVPHQLRVDRLGPVPMICFEPTPLDGWGRVFKRLFDFFFGSLLLLLLLPVFGLIALGIILDGGFPVFYISERVGQTGRIRLPVWKFRTMITGADAQRDKLKALSHRTDGPLFKVHGDPRVTRFGHILRRWSLDELPQLINVVFGEMSLVGPRPHLPSEVDQYSSFQRRVFAVKPGITGLAQVSGRSDLKFEEEMRLDLRYVEEWSMLLDLWVLWRTIFTVLGKEGAD